MSTYAIVSDIHANLEALKATLRDIESQGIDTIYCLGDIIGYGPNPRECLQLAMERFEFSLKGNHEHGVLFQPVGFSETAAQSARWTKKQLSDLDRDRDQNHSFWNYLGELDEIVNNGNATYVHASPVEPISQYVLPADIRNQRKMDQIFDEIEEICFGGHTHIPGVFEEGRDTFLSPSSLNGTYSLSRGKALINVGSVGQPRDRNKKGCYVIVKEDTVHFRRVSYPERETANKIYQIDGLPDILGKRLLAGK